MAATPGFKSQCQSSSVTPFPTLPQSVTPASIPVFFQLYWAAIVSPGRGGPNGMEPIISKLPHRLCNQGVVPPSYILGGSHSHSPGSKHGHSYSTYTCNQLKLIDMLIDCSRGYLQNCCYAEQLSMALLHAPHPPAQTCGGEDILYIFLFF